MLGYALCGTEEKQSKPRVILMMFPTCDSELDVDENYEYELNETLVVVE